MTLDVGSEMIYHFDCGVALSSKKLFTIADSRYVLVDFLATPDARGIVLGTERLLNLGYIPIVAHVERYPCRWNKIDKIRHMSELGAVIQINAASLSGGLFSKSKRQCVKLLSQELVDVVASDAHGLTERTPSLEAAVKFVISKFGEEYAEHIFSTVPKKIISNQRI